MQLAATKGYIYAIAGRNATLRANVHISSVERYDPKMDVWVTIVNVSAPSMVGLLVLETIFSLLVRLKNLLLGILVAFKNLKKIVFFYIFRKIFEYC